MTLELERSLTDIGLERNEAIVYTALLRLKSATAGEIAKHIGLHRRSVYDTVDSLLRKGFATYIKKNDIKYYQTAGVERLKEEVKRKENALETVLSQLSFIDEKRFQHSVSVYEGVGGIKTVLQGMFEYAKEGDEVIGFGEKGGFSSLFPDLVCKLKVIRLKKNVKIRRLVNKRPGIEDALRKTKWGWQLQEIKFLPEGFNPSLGLWVCRDRTIVWFLKDNPQALLIDNPEIARGFREQFDYFWNLEGTVITAKGPRQVKNKRPIKNHSIVNPKKPQRQR